MALGLSHCPHRGVPSQRPPDRRAVGRNGGSCSSLGQPGPGLRGSAGGAGVTGDPGGLCVSTLPAAPGAAGLRWWLVPRSLSPEASGGQGTDGVPSHWTHKETSGISPAGIPPWGPPTPGASHPGGLPPVGLPPRGHPTRGHLPRGHPTRGHPTPGASHPGASRRLSTDPGAGAGLLQPGAGWAWVSGPRTGAASQADHQGLRLPAAPTRVSSVHADARPHSYSGASECSRAPLGL